MKTLSNSGRHGRHAVGGFTLIELIVVITILGVLAAVALPRFTSLQSDARKAKADAMFGSIRAASAIVKSTALVKGISCGAASGNSVTLEGRAIALAYCYPTALTATNDGILGAANIDPAADGVTVALAGTTLTVSINGAATSGCSITYTEPAGAELAPNIANLATSSTAC